MPTPSEPKKNERASTYFVQDRQNQNELTRLTIQDHLLNVSMGGVLPEQIDPERFQRVLDVGCGSGSWVIEAAQAYPTMSLDGIDISAKIIAYAREQAESNQVADRVTFQVMDALHGLDFPDNTFDLVNLRLGVSFLRTWDWPRLLSEMLRVVCPGGVIRLTDQEIMHQSNSAAVTQCNEVFLQAFFQAGHLFEPESTGITAHLVPLLTRYGCQHIQTRLHALEFQAGTPEGQAYYENMSHVFRTSRPFLQKWASTANVDEQIYQQALYDMQQADFHVTWNFLTAWGTKRDR